MQELLPFTRLKEGHYDVVMTGLEVKKVVEDVQPTTKTAVFRQVLQVEGKMKYSLRHVDFTGKLRCNGIQRAVYFYG